MLHPDSTKHYNVHARGIQHLKDIVYIIQNNVTSYQALNLALKCLTNLFKNQSNLLLHRDIFTDLVNSVKQHLTHEKKEIRRLAAAVFMNFSISLVKTNDNEGKKALLEVFATYQPNDEDERVYS